MHSRLLIASALMIGVPLPAAAVQNAAAQAVADSTQPNSSVSLAVEPLLSDGRLVIKMAAKNLGSAPVQFGPSHVRISKPSGEVIALYPFHALVNDVRIAAGLEIEEAPGGRPAAGTYAAPQLPVDNTGRVDVSGYTGGSAVAPDETIRRSQRRRPKASIGKEDAERQIAVLESAILQDSMIPPGEIAAGQLVSSKLQFGSGEDRTLHIRIRVGSDEHGFTVAAPAR